MSKKTSAIDALVFFLLAVLLVFAPLIKGGNRPVPLLAMELMALPLLAYVIWKPAFKQHLNLGFQAALALLVFYPLLQYLPVVPAGLQGYLPGREVYASGLTEFGSGLPVLGTISLIPSVTELAWLAMLPPLAVFLLALGSKEPDLKRLIYIFLVVAAFQAVLALIQFGGGTNSVFRLRPDDYGDAVGTYVNRNHLAGLLEMALPIALGLLAAGIGHHSGGLSRYAGNWFKRVKQFLVHLPRPNQTMVSSALFILLMLALILGRSRSGTALGMGAIFLSALLYGRHIGGVRSGSLVTLIAAIGLALVAIMGLAPVWDRFTVEDTLRDERWLYYSSGLVGLWEFFPFGSGLGTFPDVYRRFQPDAVADFVNHAHNDYIEFVFDTGLPGIVVIMMFLGLYFLRWPSLLRHANWGTFTFMQVGAGIGLLLIALHSLTDFNLHIPANAIYFALLAAVFFHRGERFSRAEPPPQRVEPDNIAVEEMQVTKPVATKQKGQNPFMD